MAHLVASVTVRADSVKDLNQHLQRDIFTELAWPSLRDLPCAIALTYALASRSVSVISWPWSCWNPAWPHCQMCLALALRQRRMDGAPRRVVRRTGPAAFEPCPFSLCTTLLWERSLAALAGVLFFKNIGSNVSDAATSYNTKCWK